ncbi:hypothetical protein OVY01_19290 [Robbsia sp. Bb-Pol-6]|uniref:Transposase n=1 Tax=Robbsia betulipollinis TaxID=2981849 RepID=A0ABT3ZSU2_9BURK|nr:hypothetical protein [Robbsia betulipollinis]MCY0389295.1 hypothetical protein [Robbsia betulipollinis]
MKYTWITQHNDIFNVSRMCRQLGVSRSGYCQWRVLAPSKRICENTLLDAQVAQISTSGKYGVIFSLSFYRGNSLRRGALNLNYDVFRTGIL